MTEVTSIKTVATRLRRMAREPKSGTEAAPEQSGVAPPKASRVQTKSSMVLSLLVRLEGATLDQLVEATGWLPHTARAALTGLKKKGHAITSDKADGGARIYRAAQHPALLDGGSEPDRAEASA